MPDSTKLTNEQITDMLEMYPRAPKIRSALLDLQASRETQRERQSVTVSDSFENQNVPYRLCTKPGCGKYLLDTDWNFCPKCGSRLEWKSARVEAKENQP